MLASFSPTTQLLQAVALVDYDNLSPTHPSSRAEFELNSSVIIDALALTFRDTFPSLTELDVRFYGGWTDEYGLPSPSATLLLSILPSLRGRRYGLIVRPHLATSLIQFADFLLSGTVRLHAKRRRQKMVDGMLGCDATFVANEGVAIVGLVTDDDDLLPTALTAMSLNTRAFAWFRRRSVGSALNDRQLIARGMLIGQIQEP